VKLDFALILTALTGLAGLVWLVDALFFAKARKLMVRDGEEVTDPGIVEYARSLFPVLLFVLTLRSFVAEPFRIPSGSMMPNLLVGDFILVNKYNYGLRLPVLNRKIVAIGEPRRGDVMVFRYPGMGPDDPTIGTDYIKRVIGLPGDVVTVKDNRVTLNGVAVGYQDAGYFEGHGAGLDMTGANVFTENLPGRSHTLLELPGTGFDRHDGTWTVPAGNYFVMGDNRDNSEDSRFWGFVPEQNLVGRAMVIWLNCEGWACSDGFDYSRIGDTIH
jgi:signal peptidase I